MGTPFFLIMGLFDKTPIADLLMKAKAITENELFINVISQTDTQKLIVKLNTDQMKVQYMDANGVLLSSVGGGYSDTTMQGGSKAGKFKVDLYDSGDYHESFRVESIKGTGFVIKSDPIKDDGTNLLEEWGKDVEGLTFESLDKLSVFLIKKYQELILRKLTT